MAGLGAIAVRFGRSDDSSGLFSGADQPRRRLSSILLPSTLLGASRASKSLPCGLPRLFAAYHPSQQKTQTGRLTPAMFRRVLRRIRRHLQR